MSGTDFGREEIPLIPGELYGMRAFRVNDTGTLSPLLRSTDTVYQSGVQEAECDAGSGGWTFYFGKNSAPYVMPSYSSINLHPKHPAPVLECSCGFYAYFDQTDDTTFMSNVGNTKVLGIVRATGKCIVGDLGFRAGKMEIVGLVAGQRTFKSLIAERNYMARLCGAIAGLPSWFFWMILGLQIMMSVVSIGTDDGTLDVASWIMTGLVWTFVFVQMMCVSYLLWRMRKDDPLEVRARPSRKVAKAIRKQYPDIEMFATLAEARAKYPLSKASELPT